MIIQCPSCGFAGRIPSYALGTPHNAKCPKCQIRFELSALSLESELSLRAIEEGSDDSLDALTGDPSSSAYELKAITDDLAAGGPWDGDEASRRDPTSRNRRAANGRGVPDAPGSPQPALDGIPAGWLERFGLATSHPIGDPWYSRILLVWGIVLLLWAALILGRSVLLMFFAGGQRPDGGAGLIPAVVSVLLLVPGAASLFLLVDLGRYLRDLHAPAQHKSAASPKQPPSMTTDSRLRRLWHRPLHAASFRPEN